MERELGVEVSDYCLTMDRGRLDERVACGTGWRVSQSAAIQNTLAVTRSSYTSVQKDANARIVIRIEKAMREARKLRTAAEQDHMLEGPVFSEIRTILGSTYTTCLSVCLSIVDQIRDASVQLLRTIDPLRKPHRDSMCSKIDAVRTGWNELEKRLVELLMDFKNEAFTLLGSMTIAIANAWKR